MAGHAARHIPSPRLVSSSVADPDGLLAVATRLAVDKLLRGTPHEVAFAIVSRALESNFEKYCKKLFDLWGIGSKGVNDGVLYVLALNQRQHRIVTGRGIQTYLPDAACQEILVDAGKLLKKGEVDAAVLGVARQIVNSIWWRKVWRRLRPFVLGAALLLVLLVWNAWRRYRQRARAYAERAGRLKRLVDSLEERSSSEDLAANPCPVCLDCLGDRPLHASDFLEQGLGRVGSVELLRCGHLAHDHCLSEWFQRSQTCPLCRLDDPRVVTAATVPVVLSLASTDTLRQLREALNFQFEDLGNSQRTYLWQRHFEGSSDESATLPTSSGTWEEPSSWSTERSDSFGRSSGNASGFGGGSCSGGGGAGGSW